jgi:hypothetical protein
MSPQGHPTPPAGAIGSRPRRKPPGLAGLTGGPRHTGAHSATPRGSRPTSIVSPSLRLVHPPESDESSLQQRKARDDAAPIMDAADPRWVLAVRTSQCLQGAILAPEQRDRLLILARLLGLTPFDANLIIAIVQDQARRGHAKEYCAAAGRNQLAMIPLPTRARLRAAIKHRAPLRTAWLVAGFIAFELLALAWWLWLR